MRDVIILKTELINNSEGIISTIRTLDVSLNITFPNFNFWVKKSKLSKLGYQLIR